MSPLALALPAMTMLQAIVALGAFALSVLAPQLGISVAQLGALNTVLFGVGALGSLFAGRLIRRLGDLWLACACLVAVAAAMLCLGLGARFGAHWVLWIAVLLLGLAFGPETPASTSVLSRVTPAARRPLVFSVRQTGNQIGAIAGSLLLPALLLQGPGLPYALVGGLACAGALWCALLARGQSLRPTRTLAQGVVGMSPEAIGEVVRSRPLRLLAFATLAYSATQMCLNTFLMSYVVREWQQPVAAAALLVALLQAGGLAGRLFWGWVGQRIGGGSSLAALLGALGLLMAVSGALLVLWRGAAGGMVFGVLVASVGFSASGWNGVMLAEVARIAGPARAGAVSGAVLMFGYAGLAVAPLAFVATSAQAGMTAAFLGLFALALVAGCALLAARAGPAGP